jgi:outer membrane protein TolC
LRRFIIFFLTLFSLNAFAADPVYLPLYRVIDSALAQDAEYNLVKQDRDAAVEKIDEALDTFVPSVRASASMSSVDKSRDDFKDVPLYKVPSAKVRLSQVLFNDSKLAAMSTNENRAKAQRLVAEVLRTDIIADSSKRYCNAIRYSDQIRAAEAANTKFAWAAKKFKIKQVNSINYSGSKKALDDTLEDLALVTNITNADQYDFLPYSNIFESPAVDDLKVIFTTEGVNIDALSAKFTDKALTSAPQLLALDEFIKINRRDIVAAQRKFTVPDVSVTGEYTRYFEGENTDPEFFKTLEENQWNMSLKLSIPLFDGTKKQNELLEKQSELLTYFTRKSQVKEMVKQSVASAVDMAALTGRDYKFKLDAFKKVEDKYVGLSTLRKYSEAKALINQYYAAKQKLIESEYLFMTALLEVQRSYGKFFFYNADDSDKRFMDDLLYTCGLSR